MDFFSIVEVVYGDSCLQLHSAELFLNRIIIEISPEQLQQIRETNGELNIGSAAILKFSRSDSRLFIRGKKYRANLTSIRRLKFNKFHAVFTFSKLTPIENKELRNTIENILALVN
tara:strand:- start:6122 stop:6469 length:348 start_codon:yes stop_codon:yes gene_type:complete